MYIKPGSKILSGNHSPHQCKEKGYKYIKIRGILTNPSGKEIEYNMLQCNKCGLIVMNGGKVHDIEHIYTNYEFIHIPKQKKSSTPTKRQLKNAQYVTDCAVADAQGKPRPKRKGKQEKPSIETPDYVFRGEAPRYIQQNAAHPFKGGGVSPK